MMMWSIIRNSCTVRRRGMWRCEEEILHLVAVRIQIEVRGYLARKRFKVLAKEIARRREDMSGSAIVVQSLIRGRVDRIRAGEMRWTLRQHCLVRMNAATRIQSTYRAYLAKTLRLALMFENKIRGLMEIWAATTTQRVFRGLIGRNLYKFMRRERNRQIAAATQIQRMIRGFLVPAWRVREVRARSARISLFSSNYS